jgi:hypothetical protein
LFALPGCIIWDYSEGQRPRTDNISKLVVGQTTRAQVLDWFGAPQGMADASMLENILVDRELLPGPVTNLPFADVLVFRITELHARALFLLLFIPIETRVKSDTLVVFFDDHDKVSYYGFTKGTDAPD